MHFRVLVEHEHAGLLTDEALLHKTSRMDARNCFDLLYFGTIMTAILTLLGLIIGFSFSMAIYRYDQRKVLKEAEANAIGTEYVRADFLPAPSATKVRALLREYLDQRLLYYTTRDEQQLVQIESATAQLEAELWSAVQIPTAAQPTAPLTITAMGMNDVLNSRGYTQAAWLNRIPNAAWCLMAAIAVCANLLIGYGGQTVLVLALSALAIGVSIARGQGTAAAREQAVFHEYEPFQHAVPLPPQVLHALLQTKEVKEALESAREEQRNNPSQLFQAAEVHLRGLDEVASLFRDFHQYQVRTTLGFGLYFPHAAPLRLPSGLAAIRWR